MIAIIDYDALLYLNYENHEANLCRDAPEKVCFIRFLEKKAKGRTG